MNPDSYLKSAGLTLPSTGGGGQELILNEIKALLDGYDVVWLPFPEGCVTLEGHLKAQGHKVIGNTLHVYEPPIDAVYLGTPTIVGGKPLFPDTAGAIYTKKQERETVRRVVQLAEEAGARRIVTGLGSGDISVRERKRDMGRGSRVEVVKHFDVFTDWVLVRDL